MVWIIIEIRADQRLVSVCNMVIITRVGYQEETIRHSRIQAPREYATSISQPPDVP